ncbi:1-acyl-sn-glycerol-3-phosphate acyltransferase [Neptunomonas sp.]|uniref:1-acyl-sn-glycerol-3-phosphate acyltransferase n=1 Tax=Neptunomonas TaxID=75687 RepID=UPI003518396D
MFTFFCRLCFKLQGWKIVGAPPADISRSVMIGAPHTSNWDFIFTMAAADILNVPPPRFTIKQEWMRFPFNLLLGPMGAIPINRSARNDGEKRPNMVGQMVEYIEKSDEITVLVTPEATRAAVTRWRTGFYQVALQANVPILLGYLDYKKREAGVGGVIYPSGNIEEDLRKIWDFYNKVTPKFPECYTKM